MIGIIDALDEMIALVYNSPVKSSISGSIDIVRPINSEREDISINGLPITFEQLQDGNVNVNLHVPNLKVTQNGIENTKQPNRPRLRTLQPIVYNAIHNKKTDRIYTTVVNSQLFIEDKSSYINFRVNIKAKNL